MTMRGAAPQLVVLAALAAVVILLGLFPAFARALTAAKPGTLDRAFGQGGRVIADFGTEGARDAEAKQVIPTVDGGLLVLDQTSITKYGSDGSVDRSFGLDGSIVRINWAIAMAIDSQGRIIVVSSPDSPAGTVTFERFLQDGSVDRSFGSDGAREVKIARGRMGSITSLLTQPDGKLLLIGSGYNQKTEGQWIGATRLLPSGAIDRAYGNGGCASIELPTSATAPDPVAALDGEDLILGAFAAKYVGEPSFFAVRFDAEGDLDPGFGNGGTLRSNLVEAAIGIAVGPDGRLTIVDSNEKMARLLANGDPDLSFGNGGALTEEHPRGIAVAMALEPDGSTLIANWTGRSFLLERRRPDGSLDPSFGGGRRYAIQTFAGHGESEARAAGLALIPGRGALVYGYAPATGRGYAPALIAAALFGPAGEPVPSFGSGGTILSRPQVKSQDFGFDLLAGSGGVAVTGRASGRILLRRYRFDGSVDRSFRSGEPTLPPSGAYLGDEGNVLAAAPGGGFFLGTGSSRAGGIYRFARGGGLQSSYGIDGKARAAGLDRILDVAPMEDGSLYAVGISLGACGLELARFRPGGSLDRSFGGRGGLRRIGYGSGPCTFHDVGLAQRRNGAVVVAGEVSEGILDEYAPSGRRLALHRHHPAYLGRSERLRAIALDPRGRILLVGRIKHNLSVTRLDPSGHRDRSFGRDGVARIHVGRFAEGSDLGLEADGRIVVAGFTELCPKGTSCHGSSPLVARLDPNGHLDRSFAAGGVWAGKPGEGAGLKALALGPGSIYATGWQNRSHTGRDLLLLRLHR
jgi:uncharacterized delta-60 repeat protein